MVDLGTAVAAKLIEVIGGKTIQTICDIWDFKSQLEELKQNVSTIQTVLLDAEAKQELSNEEQDFVERLKDAVYDADDLFDELLTLAELQQLKGPLSKRGKLYEKVRCLFSSKNQVSQAYRISREVKKIMKRLDVIVHTHKKYGLNFDHKPIRMRREESHSYVIEKQVIGREKDKEVILNMLLDHINKKEDHDIFVVSIVGVGGLGKTTVAQLVYDHDSVKEEFGTRIWVCVSDEVGSGKFDVSEILCKILDSITGKNFDRTSSMQVIQEKFEEELKGKKYLLVLDDIWNEDREIWLKLEMFLMLGHGGSRIIVTTRSKTTANIIGSKHTHELKGLSYEYSWQLFELMAFNEGHETKNYHELVEIGKTIVKKCRGSPLAIRVVGSMLFGQDISKWRSFLDIGLAEIKKGDNAIMSVLKVSYHNLAPSLKTCFSYCSVFPKDSKIEREILISLWIAQGFIVSLDKGQSLEDAAEEHFLILLRRCFFEGVSDDLGAPIKIHDLLHDVAQEVVSGEICVVNSITNNLKDKVRHVHYIGEKCPQNSFIGSSKIRSFFCSCKETPFAVDTYVEKWMFLRVLDLSSLGIRSLPGSIGKLLHIRYLNMSYNEDLVGIPDAVKRLHNLQTLILHGCKSLSELPKDFCQLVKLRHLDLSGCDKLICMPWGMDKLTSLKVLPNFMVGRKNSTEAQTDHDELKALKCLTEIRGELSIKIGEHYRRSEGMIQRSGGYLKSMKHLTRVGISFENKPGRCVDHDEAAMEALEPPSNLKRLTIYNYKGTTIPSWGRAVDNWAVSLFRLVDISLQGCSNLQEMPILSKLPNLKALALHSMDKLEYMETKNNNNNTDTSNADTTTFFPSLLTLGLYGMEKLKGWWKEDQPGVDDHRQSFGFPFLCQLTIGRCPNLTTFPACPSLEELELYDNKMLWSSFPQNLRILKFKYLSNMTSLPEGIQYLNSLQSLELFRCDRIKALPEWISCLSSLQSLSIYRCLALKTLPEAMRNLTTLQRLYIGRCRDLEERCKKPNGEDYPKVQHIPSISLSIDGRY